MQDENLPPSQLLTDWRDFENFDIVAFSMSRSLKWYRTWHTFVLENFELQCACASILPVPFTDPIQNEVHKNWRFTYFFFSHSFQPFGISRGGKAFMKRTVYIYIYIYTFPVLGFKISIFRCVSIILTTALTCYLYLLFRIVSANKYVLSV